MNKIQEIKKWVDANLNSPNENNAKLIKSDIESGEVGGRYCRYACGKDQYYVVCATSTDEDYYWVGLDQQRNVHFSSCVGRMDPIEPNINFSVLDYLIKYDPKSIYDKVVDFINSTGTDYLFTKINIGGKLY